MWKRIKSLLCAVVFCSSLVMSACDVETIDKTHKNGDGLEIFDMPSTTKLVRDEDYSQYYTDTPSLDYAGAKNEYESMQLMIHPKQKVSSYSLQASDLVCGENKIGKENVEIYHLYYTELKRHSSGTQNKEDWPLGWYPDALVPQDASVAAGENVIGKNQNKGLWITIYVPKDTPAGVYTGSFTLTVDEYTQTIPVTYEVYGFTVPDDSHVKTPFSNTQSWMVGELDTTDEMVYTYAEFFANYRVSTSNFPSWGNLTNEEFVDWAKKYTKLQGYTSYNLQLPYMTCSKENFPLDPNGQSYGANTDDSINYEMYATEPSAFKEMIRALVENSTPDCNLLKKAFIYYGSLDEAHASGRQKNLKYISMQTTDLLIMVAKEYTQQQLETYGVTYEDIVGVDFLCSIPYFDECEGIRGYCPTLYRFDTQTDREKYYAAEENTYAGYDGSAKGLGNTYWYFCNNPSDPRPNDHIDGGVVSLRVLEWMMFDWGIDGVMTWGTSCYLDVGTDVSINGYYEPRHPYDDFETFYAGIGDGYFCYPGAKYGLSSPVPSVRLMSVRDGVEDYEYLYALRELSNEYSHKFALEGYDVNVFLEDIYDLIYTDTYYNPDFTKVYEAREKVIALLELVSGEAHAIVNVDEIDVNSEEAKISVYAETGTRLTVDGTEIDGVVSGDGFRFVYTLQLDKVENYFNATLSHGAYSTDISLFVSNGLVCIADFETADLSAWIIKSDNGTDYVTLSVEDGKLKAECALNDSESPFYKEAFGFTVSKLLNSVSLKDVGGIAMTVYNEGDREVNLSIVFERITANGQSKQTEAKAFTLKRGKNFIELKDLSSFASSMDLSTVTNVLLRINDSRDGESLLYVDDLYYTLKKES